MAFNRVDCNLFLYQPIFLTFRIAIRFPFVFLSNPVSSLLVIYFVLLQPTKNFHKIEFRALISAFVPISPYCTISGAHQIQTPPNILAIFDQLFLSPFEDLNQLHWWYKLPIQNLQVQSKIKGENSILIYRNIVVALPNVSLQGMHIICRYTYICIV